MNSSSYHTPVLLKESIDALLTDGKRYIDATYGGGGYSKEILNRISSTSSLMAFDKDKDVLQNLIEDSRLTFINQDYKYIANYANFSSESCINGIVADLGVSSYQFDNPERGFSVRFDGDLDMRMDAREGNKASYLLNNYTQEKLQAVFSNYGEVRNAKTLSEKIIGFRNTKNISSTSELVSIAKSCFVRGNINRYLAQVFQALRLEVNGEIDSLKEFLTSATSLLCKGGRFVVITYHSLEDRVVKRFFKYGNFNTEVKKDEYGRALSSMKVVNKKAIQPTEEEIAKNSRARSAKLRIAEKI